MTRRALLRLGAAVVVILAVLPQPAATADDAPRQDEGLVVASKLLSDGRSIPSLFGAAIGVGLGFPLTAFGYPEVTQPVSATVLPPLGQAAARATPAFTPVFDTAEPAVAGFGLAVNPVLTPPLRTGAAALEENAPGLGSKTTSRHFGLDAGAKGGDETEIPLSPAVEELNFSTRVRALPVRLVFRMPLEVEAGLPESRMETTNGYGAAIGEMNPGLLPSALLWSDVGFFGGTLAPRPGHAEAHYPTGPLASSSPVLRPLQAEGARWGDFSAAVDQHGQGSGVARAGRVEIPRLLSIASVEGTTAVENLGSQVRATAISRLSDVTLLDGAVTVNSIKLVITTSGSGSAEGRQRSSVPELQGVKVGGVPVVVLADGVRVAGNEVLPAGARRAAEKAVTDTLRSAGIALSAVPVETADSTSENGSTTQAAGAVLRIRFNRPDRPQLYQMDLGFAMSGVFTGRSIRPDSPADSAGETMAPAVRSPDAAMPAQLTGPTQPASHVPSMGSAAELSDSPSPSAGVPPAQPYEPGASDFEGTNQVSAPPWKPRSAVDGADRAVKSFYRGLIVVVLLGLVVLPVMLPVAGVRSRLSR